MPKEPENSASVLQVEEQADAKEGKVIIDYEPYVDYKSDNHTLMMHQLLRKKRKKTLLQSM